MIPPRHWQDPANAVVGVLMLVSPWPAGFALVQPAVANAVIVGTLLCIVSVGAAVMGRPWVEWATVLLGGWMLASPWALAFSSTPATRTAMLTGGLALALGLGALFREWRQGRDVPQDGHARPEG